MMAAALAQSVGTDLIGDHGVIERMRPIVIVREFTIDTLRR